MKLSILASLATLLAVGAAVTQRQKQVIVSYPDGTPDSVVETAMNEIKAAGGYITHEYKIFKCVVAALCSYHFLSLAFLVRPPCLPTTNRDPGDSPQRQLRRHSRPSRPSAHPTTQPSKPTKSCPFQRTDHSKRCDSKRNPSYGYSGANWL